MSKHANQNDGTPTSSRKAIRGHNATYLSSVQKEERDRSSTKPAGDSKRQPDASLNGSSRTTSTTKTEPGLAGYGSGHYVPNK